VSDLELYALLVGFFLPLALSIIQQSSWSTRLRAVVAFVACLVAGAGTAYFQGDLTGRRFVSATLLVLVTALATYRNLRKSTGIAPAIETKTNV
jgi:VIT1/CCC1 family predicted Fe2+/Mn2+ transporter